MTQTKRLTDHKRDCILEAAITAFKQKGFQCCSMDYIAEKARVSKRTLYKHFTSKDRLFEEITNSVLEHGVQELKLSFDPEQDLREQLLHIVQIEFDQISDPNFSETARIFLMECLSDPVKSKKAMGRFNQPGLGALGWIQQAMKQGAIRQANAEFASEQLLGPIRIFAFWMPLSAGDPVPSGEAKRELIESCVDMFISYYATKPQSAD